MIWVSSNYVCQTLLSISFQIQSLIELLSNIFPCGFSAANLCSKEIERQPLQRCITTSVQTSPEPLDHGQGNVLHTYALMPMVRTYLRMFKSTLTYQSCKYYDCGGVWKLCNPFPYMGKESFWGILYCTFLLFWSQF